MMETAEHDVTALSIVRSLHRRPPPPDGPAAELPGTAKGSPCAACGRDVESEAAAACDACERGFHACCAGAVGDEEWVCRECERGGAESKLWRLGFVSRPWPKKRRLQDGDGNGVSRKHTPSDKAFPGLPFGASDTYLNSLNAGLRLGLQKEAGYVGKEDYLSFEDIFCDKDLEEMSLQRLKEFISERHGVLEEGWCVKIIMPITGDEQVTYYAPTGKPFHSMAEVAFHLGLISNEVENKEEETGSLYVQLTDVLPVQYMDFFLLSLGQVDARPSYHKTDQIWPVGYRSCWHDKVTRSIFVGDVLDGGDSGPVFKVSRFSCSTVPVPGVCTLLVAFNHGQNEKKQDNMTGLSYDEEEHSSLQMLIADLSTEYDSQCYLGNSTDISVNDTSILKDEVGEFHVEESSPSAAWRMAAEKFVDICREMYRRRCTLNFRCQHVGDEKDEESWTYLAKLSSSSCSLKVPSVNEGGVEIETVFEGLWKWLNQDRFGLETEFVQEMIELLPGVHACSQYNSLGGRNCCSSVRNTVLQVITKDGMLIDGEDPLHRLVRSCKRVKSEIVRDTAMMYPDLPMGKPVCTKLPSEIVGDSIQVLEFFRRFSEVLAVEDLFSTEQLEMELSCPYFDDLNNSPGGNSHMTISSESALNIAHMSLLKVLYGELLSKVSAMVDPSSDLRESKSKRGRKKSLDLSVLCCEKNPIIPSLNEFTWPELARRYLLAALSMDSDADSLESGNVYRCLIGDGGELCGSLTGVLGMEADAMLLARAMQKTFGSLDRDCDKIIVDGGNPIEGNPIPEWAQLLEPVRKLPTNVGARIRKCVNAALQKDPPDWAKKILENSISKEVYKGNASGPTKKAVLSVLATVGGEGKRQKNDKEMNKTDEERNYVSISDIIMRQCRNLLRRVANADGEKVLCNFLSHRDSGFCEREDEGILGSPAKVSRPLAFRTIDLKLAVGAYDGSHEAFLEDVREFWDHVHISCGEKPDSLRLADNLSCQFQKLYESEVLGMCQKLQGYSRSGCLTADSKNEVDRLIASLGVLPKAPWEAGICKICGVDKEDNLVLLCDSCDAEYHTYCLNPPLSKVPPGNWHCPDCVSKQEKGNEKYVFDSSNNSNRNQNCGEFTAFRRSTLTQLSSLLEDKDYWECSVTERTTLLKFLCDELLNSALLRQHLEQCCEPSCKLQQKLRAAYIALRNVKQRKKMIASKFAKTGKGSALEVTEQYKDASSLPRASMEYSLGDSAEYGIELNSVTNEITHLQDTIGNLEMQLIKLSGRREFLGTDSAGRLYWVWAGRQLGVIVNDLERSLHKGSEIISCAGASNHNLCKPNDAVTLSSPWVVYQSVAELKELVDFLRDGDQRERELKWSILRRLKIRFQDPESETLDETPGALSGKGSPGFESPATKADGLLESTHGPWFMLETILLDKSGRKTKVISDDKLFRCSCLEPVIPSRYHCLSCHKTFLTKGESDGHNDNQCKSGPEASSQSQYDSSPKSGSFSLFPKLKQNEDDGLKCPYNFEDICSKFVTMDSLKDLVREIGFLGSNGIPPFIPSVSPNLSDPSLKLKGTAKDATVDNKTEESAGKSNGSHGSSSAVEPADTHGYKPKYMSPDNYCPISKSALKPLVGKASRVLNQLKMNLLDMEAALPEAALRLSRACIKRRWAWRSFVKSARTIDEMVQAMMVFEDMIKSDYLKNTWWYWSSLSAAAKISSLSALALRIYSLDAAIIYDISASSLKVEQSGATENTLLVRKSKKNRSE